MCSSSYHSLNSSSHDASGVISEKSIARPCMRALYDGIFKCVYDLTTSQSIETAERSSHDDRTCYALHRNSSRIVRGRVRAAARRQGVLRTRCTSTGTGVFPRRDHRGWQDHLARWADGLAAPVARL